MKKLLFLAAAFVAVSGASAQMHDNVRHHEDYSSYLPQKGDIATGVDIVGMVKFIGNSISDNKIEKNAITPFSNGNFFAKYFLTDKIALRAHLGVGVSNGTDREFVRDDLAYAVNPQTTAQVVDSEKFRYNSFDFGIGVEFRRSLRRVQGYVGAEALIGTSSNKNSYEYGNKYSLINTRPTSAFSTGYYARPLEESVKTISGGLAVFTGVDYFFSRNVSIGFEFSLAGYGSRSSVSEYSYEEWDATNAVVKTTSKDTYPKQHSFNIRPTAGANLMFYF
jgi:hypothetical protein